MAKLSGRPLVLCLISFVFFFGYEGIFSLVPQYSVHLNLSAFEAGLVVAVNALLPLLLTLPIGAISDRFRKKKVLVWGAVGCFGSYVLYALPFGTQGLWLGQLFSGVFRLMVWLSASAIVTEMAAEHERIRLISYFSIMVTVGVFLGPLVSGFVADNFGFSAAFSVAALSALVLVILTLRVGEAGQKGRQIPIAITDGVRALKNYREVLKLWQHGGMRLAILYTFVMLYGIGVKGSLFTVYLADGIRFAPSVIGVIYSSGTLVSILLRFFAGFLVDRFGQRAMLISSSLFIAGFFFVTPFSSSVAALTFSSILLGSGLTLNHPLGLNLVAGSSRRDQRGLAMGMRQTAEQSALLVAPFLTGLITNHLGFEAAFLLSGGLILVLTYVLFKIQGGEKIGYKQSAAV